jgi:succinate dehydrogenase / fumarate reductase flavoprotein subunit
VGETCDLLVVGGGGAALRAAIAAYERNPSLDIVLVTKGALGHSGVTATACSDRMAFHATLSTTEPGGPDAWRYHADDIYRIGGHVSDADLASVLARRAEEAFGYLDKLGVPWARRSDGSADQFVTDGSVYARACYTGPYTANHIEAALVRRLRELPIRVIEHHMVAELLLDKAGGRVRGVVLVSQREDRVMPVAAKAVILATGGAGRIYDVSVFPEDCTGDGYALAYRAGAELVNLEFIQIGLCSLKTNLACSGSMMRALGRLVNDQGEEFLARYFPPGTGYAQIYATLFAKGASWPVSYREPSHIIDIAVASERAAGRRVYLDYSRDPEGLNLAALPEHVRSWYAEVKRIDLSASQNASSPLVRLQAINRPSVEWLAARDIDLEAGDMVEIAPAIQHFQGGVKIREQGNTTIGGLYAAGEVAGGQHGANRPGGNALLDSQVFGRVAGENAARYAEAQSSGERLSARASEEAAQGLFSPNGLNAADVYERVGVAMTSACSVCRTRMGLEELCRTLDDMAKSGTSREGVSLANAVEAVNILQTAQLVARAALERDESRGPHLRFPDDGSLTPLPRDDGRWDHYVVIHKGRYGPLLEHREPVRP